MKKSALAVIAIVLLAALVIVVVIVAAGTNNKNNGNDQSQNASDQPANQSNNGNTNIENAVETSVVDIKDGGFGPAIIKVKKGTTVTWTNNGELAHTVTIDEGEGPDSPLMQPGETYKYTFNTAGTFSYHCAPHPSMQASVIVTE